MSWLLDHDRQDAKGAKKTGVAWRFASMGSFRLPEGPHPNCCATPWQTTGEGRPIKSVFHPAYGGISLYSNQSKSATLSLRSPLLLAYIPMYAPTNPPATGVLRMCPSTFSATGSQASRAAAT